MSCHSTIPVYELLGSSIQTREASALLMKLVVEDPCDFIELDFSSVEYISRAFADQFHFDKVNCAVSLQKTIVVFNACESVVDMLQVVARSQNSHDRKTKVLPVYKYSSPSQLENFLLSI